ncbi:MAG TPA: C45 family peptidase [Kofleriaceae bacterium]|nr:C45 family peptidase [Kofleriaceae bacterium]
MRVLELPAGASPREWGRIHGESFRGEVKALAAIRTYLCQKTGAFKSNAQVLAAAEAHLPVLARYHAGLHEELCGIAEGAACSAAEIVVANHYTDLRDLDPDPSKWTPAPQDGGCSVVWSETPTGRILAQTWDMHATAIPYVMMLRVPESADGPAAWFLTLTGCLGLAGMNTARTAIAINNLYSNDATVGVVWPAVVRRALHMTSAAAARDLVLGSPIGSGHHYFVADRREAFGIETSGRLRKVIYTGERGAYQHTNHCVDPTVGAVSSVSKTSTTYERYAWLEKSLGARALRDLADVWERLGSEDGWPKSVCTNMSTPENPHGTATCGAIATNLDTGEIWAEGGLIHNVRAEIFSL